MEGPLHLAPRIVGKLVLPLTILFAFYLTATTENTAAGGLTLSLAIALHALIFGPAATGRALPAAWLKAACGAGIVMLILGALAEQRGLAAARGLGAAGALLTIGAALALAFVALAGRAHALRDEDW